jgi:hypothetical protein
MMQQVLTPTVEYGEEANFRAQMFGIGGNRAQGLSGGPEQNAVDEFLILISNGCDLFRNGEYDMKILAVEEFGLPFLDPLGASQRLTFWAVTIAAGAVTDTLVAALIALLEMSAEGRGPAYLDGSHDAPLPCGHRRAMLLPIGFAVEAEDIRYFQLRTIHGPGAQKC